MEIAGAQSAYRLLDVLTEVALHGEGRTANEVAQALGLTASTAHRLLRVLCDRGFARQDSVGGPYRPGPQLRLLAGSGADTAGLSTVARPLLLELRDLTNETVFLSVRDGLSLSYLEVLVSSHSVQMYGAPGMRIPLHATSQGKVILAFADEGVVERVIAQLDCVEYTPHTITDRAQLLETIEAVRATGYAVNREEREIGVRSVSAPVLDHEGYAIAAVCVGGPIYRVSEEDLQGRLAEVTVATARKISQAYQALRPTAEFLPPGERQAAL